MTKKQKLPSGLEKKLQKLVDKSRKSFGKTQSKLLRELKERIDICKVNDYSVNKYVRLYRQIMKQRMKKNLSKYEDILKDHGVIKYNH